MTSNNTEKRASEGRELTAFIILLDKTLDSALVSLVKPLGRQSGAGGPEASVVHGVLEGIVLPAEDIVAVLAVSSALLCQR